MPLLLGLTTHYRSSWSFWYVPYSFYIIFQTRTFYHKIILIDVFSNSYNSFLFSSHTLAWACVLHLKLSGQACFLYVSVMSQWISMQLVLQLTLCMHLQVQHSSYNLKYSRSYFIQQSKRFFNSYLNRYFLVHI